MKNIITYLLALSALAFGLAGCTDVEPAEEMTDETDTTEEMEVMIMDDLAMHNTAEDCYLAVNGNVYDVTAFIDEHPGGPEKVLDYCGMDGTAAFSAAHEEGAFEKLDEFYLMPLAE